MLLMMPMKRTELPLRQRSSVRRLLKVGSDVEFVFVYLINNIRETLLASIIEIIKNYYGKDRPVPPFALSPKNTGWVRASGVPASATGVKCQALKHTHDM